MSYTNWFIPLCIGVSIMFSIAIVILTIATLSFRSKVKRKYDRGSSVTDFFLVISIISIWIAVLESIIIMAGAIVFIHKQSRQKLVNPSNLEDFPP